MLDHFICLLLCMADVFSGPTLKKKNFWKTWVLLVGLLIPLFWISGEICPGFYTQGGSPCLLALSLACNRIIRFTYGATPADLLTANMAAKLFSSTYLQTSIGGAQDLDLSYVSLSYALPTELCQLGI